MKLRQKAYWSNFPSLVIFLVILLSLSGCADKKEIKNIDRIKSSKAITFGVNSNVPKFALYNPETNQIEGFEIDLATLIKNDLIGEDGTMKLKAVNVKTRSELLNKRQIDAAIATFTITQQRAENFEFTDPYYKDFVGLLTLKDKPFSDLKSMDGSTIAVMEGTTSKQALEEESNKIGGLNLTFKSYANRDDLKNAINNNEVDAFCIDKSILLGYLDGQTKILDISFSPQEYGIATNRREVELGEYMEEFIDTHQKEIDELAIKWGLKEETTISSNDSQDVSN